MNEKIETYKKQIEAKLPAPATPLPWEINFDIPDCVAVLATKPQPLKKPRSELILIVAEFHGDGSDATVGATRQDARYSLTACNSYPALVRACKAAFMASKPGSPLADQLFQALYGAGGT